MDSPPANSPATFPPGGSFRLVTFGCKANQYDSQRVREALARAGWRERENEEEGPEADLVVINTCTVTQKASMQSRQAIRQAIRSNPKARIIVTGCYAQTEPDEIKKIKGVHHVIGHFDKHKIPDMILAGKENTLPSSVLRNQFLHSNRVNEVLVFLLKFFYPYSTNTLFYSH